MSQKDKDQKKKKQQNWLEQQIFVIMEKGMKEALDAAIDELLKEWE